MKIVKLKHIRSSITIFIIYLLVNMFILTCQSPVGKTIYVGDKLGSHYTSIQDAINNSTDGDIIYVYNSTYNETITITNKLTIIGLDKPIIYGIKEKDTTVNIYADNVTLNGFIIRGNNTSDNTKGVYITSNNNIITNCSIVNFYRGIYLYRSKNNLIYNNTFKANRLDAIDLIKSDNNYIIENIFYNNEISAVNLWNANKNLIEKNNVKNNNNTGIYLSSSSNNTIIKNTLQNNTVCGIRLILASNNNTLYYNNLIDNKIQAIDECINTWSNLTSKQGNFWSDYESLYYKAFEQDETWDIPYNISEGISQDLFPLVKKYAEKSNIIYDKENINNNTNNIKDCIIEIIITIILFIIVIILFTFFILHKKKK